MPIYYRGDSRHPHEVFKDGFTPRSEPLVHGKNWWQTAIRVSSSNTNSESKRSLVVCLTTNFRSAVLFPVKDGEDEMFVYAISLPDSCKVKFNELEEIESCRNIDSPVFDLHFFQVAEVFANWNRNKDRNIGYVACSLCAFEAFTPNIDAKHIICAIKCKRSSFFPNTAGRSVYSQDDRFTNLFDRNFIVDNTIYVNNSCSLDDRESEKEMCVESYKQLANGRYTTTPTSHGLGGLELPSPKQERLFIFYLRTYNFKAAIKSLITSLSVMAVNLITILKPKNRSKFAIENEPHVVQVTPQNSIEPTTILETNNASFLPLASKFLKSDKLLDYKNYDDNSKIEETSDLVINRTNNGFTSV